MPDTKIAALILRVLMHIEILASITDKARHTLLTLINSLAANPTTASREDEIPYTESGRYKRAGTTFTKPPRGNVTVTLITDNCYFTPPKYKT